MLACERDGCTGTIARTGYCRRCGLPPKSPATALVGSRGPAAGPARLEPAGERPTRVTSTTVTRPPQTTGQGSGGAHVPLPVVELPEPDSRVRPVPGVAEEERFCGKQGCGAAVGRSVDGGPPRDEGFCGECGSPFSFKPKLGPGDVVAGRYEVRGCIARGGLGFVYLAKDVRLGQHVALKGLIDVNNTAAVRIAENESQVLIALGHPNIVRILDVVTHDEAGYIVMEFVDGLSLREVKNRGRASLSPERGMLLVEHVVAYGREILTALSYLHGQGLLYCDMKPDNVIHGDRRVKLIDFGGIRRIGDRESPWVVTEHYQFGTDDPKARRAEVHERGLTVRSDIHTVGMTLRELYNASDGWKPGTAELAVDPAHPAAFGIESFVHVLRRAVAPYERRFAGADEMLVQLDGVLNEILSLRDGRSRPAFSTLFAEPTALVDAGLGDVPSVRDLIAGDVSALVRGPTPQEIALGLPAPREDPDDGQVAFLRTVRAPDATRLLKKLAQAAPSVEVEFRRCRAFLEVADVAAATASVREATRLLGGRAAHDWRVRWHEGLVDLASGHVAAAVGKFTSVHHDIPGEETPKLALGLCLEHLDEDPGRYCGAVWLHRAQVSAAFALARVALRGGDRAGAVRVLDQVPEFSRHDEAARIAGVRVLTGPLRGSGGEVLLPGAGDFAEAEERLSALGVDDVRADRLRAAVLDTALKCVEHDVTPPAGALLGDQPTERALRDRLERTLRHLAWQASSRDEHDVLIDLANERRPITLV